MPSSSKPLSRALEEGFILSFNTGRNKRLEEDCIQNGYENGEGTRHTRSRPLKFLHRKAQEQRNRVSIGLGIKNFFYPLYASLNRFFGTLRENCEAGEGVAACPPSPTGAHRLTTVPKPTCHPRTKQVRRGIGGGRAFPVETICERKGRTPCFAEGCTLSP